MVGLYNLAIPNAVKRKVFFSFHYEDVIRVNNVRNAWKIDHPDSLENRSFYDCSLWESKRLTNPNQVKLLIQRGIKNTSAACVLIGTNTWQRRWVKYEIARSVIDGRGLVAIHLNSLRHHKTRLPNERGFNPINLMGIARRSNGSCYLCEYKPTPNGWAWFWYDDYTLSVSTPKYIRVAVNEPVSFASFTREYDFALQLGHKNIGGWIDLAAQDAGR